MRSLLCLVLLSSTSVDKLSYVYVRVYRDSPQASLFLTQKIERESDKYFILCQFFRPKLRCIQVNDEVRQEAKVRHLAEERSGEMSDTILGGLSACDLIRAGK